MSRLSWNVTIALVVAIACVGVIANEDASLTFISLGDWGFVDVSVFSPFILSIIISSVTSQYFLNSLIKQALPKQWQPHRLNITRRS
jgi:hypothetical protein